MDCLFYLATRTTEKPMLTVKHISVTHHESIYECSRVTYHPKKEDAPGEFLEPQVFIEHPNGMGGGFFALGGRVYVMNNDGKTVSKWDLEQMPFPEGLSNSP